MHSVRFLLAATLSVGFASAQTCDRACLKTALDQYLNAVVNHDPKAAPLFAGFRQTDNGVVVRPGTGTWQSITSLGKVQRSYFDPVSGQAAYLGLIEEGQATGVATRAHIKWTNASPGIRHKRTDGADAATSLTRGRR